MSVFNIAAANSVVTDINALQTTDTGNTVTVAEDGFLICLLNGSGIALQGFSDIAIAGLVESRQGSGITLFPKADDGAGGSGISISDTGRVFGAATGIYSEVGTILTNHGTIKAFGDGSGNHAGVTLAGGDVYHRVVNLGTISGYGDDGTDTGTGLRLVGGNANQILNHGVIEGYLAVDGRDATSVINLYNACVIDGKVRLGGYDDIVTQDTWGRILGTVDLGGGADTFYGNDSCEHVLDNDGSDAYQLGGGNDKFGAVKFEEGVGYIPAYGDGHDTADGGSGCDTYDASNATSALCIDLAAGKATGLDVGNDRLIGFENACGGSSDDKLIGSHVRNALSGNSGADWLLGGGGGDSLSGGHGYDRFVYTRLADSTVALPGRDCIVDFNTRYDVIDLSALDANCRYAGNQSFRFVDTACFTGRAGELKTTYAGGNTIVSADVNGDKRADFAITLKGYHDLSANDFVL